MDQRVEIDVEMSKSKVNQPDRVSVQRENVTKIDKWISQIVNAHRGVRINRNDLINWILKVQSHELPKAMEIEIAKSHYDEERFLRDTLEEFRRARAEGKLFDWKKTTGIKDLKSPYKRRSKKLENSEE